MELEMEMEWELKLVWNLFKIGMKGCAINDIVYWCSWVCIIKVSISLLCLFLGKDMGSLTLSLPTMPPDLYVHTPPSLSPTHSRVCCEAHAPSRSRSASSQSEASSQQSSNQSESTSHHSCNQSQLSSHHSSSSKITDVWWCPALFLPPFPPIPILYVY